jgi:hypothetical protein
MVAVGPDPDEERVDKTSSAEERELEAEFDRYSAPPLCLSTCASTYHG